MSIFEGEDETAVRLGRGSELSASVSQDLRLDPLRHAIGALLDEQGRRVGTIVTEVQPWWDRAGVLGSREVDAREVVEVEVGFDPVELGDDGYPVVLPWVDASLEPGDELIGELLAGRLPYPGRDLRVQWCDAASASRERLAWDRRYNDPGPSEAG